MHLVSKKHKRGFHGKVFFRFRFSVGSQFRDRLRWLPPFHSGGGPHDRKCDGVHRGNRRTTDLRSVCSESVFGDTGQFGFIILFLKNSSLFEQFWVQL